MKRFVVSVLSCTAVAALMLTVAAPQAFAIRPFRVQFEKRYVKKDSTDPKDVAFRDACTAAGCDICHVGEERVNRNAYGATLDPWLDHETDKAEVDKIQAALEKAEAVKSNPSDPTSPTFGERIKQGKLPIDVPATTTP